MELKEKTTLIIHGTIVPETANVIQNCLSSGLEVIYSGWTGKPLSMTHENLICCYSDIPTKDPDGRNTTIISSRKGLKVSKTSYSWLMKSDEIRPINTCLSSFAKNDFLGKRLFTPAIYEDVPFGANLSMFGATKDLLRVFNCELDENQDENIADIETYILANYMDFYSTLVCNMRLRWREYLTSEAKNWEHAINASRVTMHKYFRKF